MPRLALKFGYNGSSFYGYQRQPGVRTVEGDIISACTKMQAFSEPSEADFASASRTDRGVHAIGNVVAFNTDFDPEKLLDGLNANCRDILFHSYLTVVAAFNPRMATMRHYRYLLYDDVDSAVLNSVLQNFVGSKDFRNFAKSDARGRFRKIDSIEAHREKECIVIDFHGRSFLHNMIRRLVAAGLSVTKGLAEEEDITRALNGGGPGGFGLAPPQYLILMDVDYGMSFHSVVVKQENAKRWLTGLDTLKTLEFVEKTLLKSAGL